ncbi:MAG: hypothetical protein KBG80_06175 [Breznakibacter sp.]|nr:hypothetical protein [Breznakibacter sp.]
MKKFLLLVSAVLCMASVDGQKITKAFGGRIGDGSAFGLEASYQHPLSKMRRLELDGALSFHNDWMGISATCLHQWVWNIENGFQWYLGAGGTIGQTFVDNKYGDDDTYFSIAFNPNGGVEYFFKNIPLQLAVDARPSLTIVNSKHVDNLFSIGVAARYVF